MLKATVSGSFHRHMRPIYETVGELTALGVKVLSPADPRVVDFIGEFLFVASDRVRSVKLVEDRHLHSIAQSDFVWLVAPDGYVGQSASLELGFSLAAGVPIYSDRAPTDLTVKQYVRVVENLQDCVSRAKQRESRRSHSNFLVDPTAAVEAAHERLDTLAGNYGKYGMREPQKLEHSLAQTSALLIDTFCLPPRQFR